HLTPLKYNELEAKAIHDLIGGDLLLGAEATEARFREVAGDYQILHLATHAAANDTIGGYSFLAFNPIKDSIENEMLFVKDLYTMELHADLVVLSACETGIGEWQRGEGIVSLGRGFLYAGARSIVTTLWSVDDRSSSRIMEDFYKNLSLGYRKDKALQISKLNYLNQASPVKAHPFFWAAYIPVGQMEAIQLKQRKSPWAWLFS
ncbi:MAG: CHAT domain-containing protein, partial [Phaeodactylibacter sp.]|nr:CHAT domain-containing protein [Phaeodactylibacter sp.]